MKLKFNFLLCAILSFVGLFAQPTVPAADPTHAATNVLSLYSDVYTNVTGTDFFPNWGQSTVVADFPIGTNNTKRMTAFNYQGIIPTPALDLTTAAMQNVHIDLWTPVAPDPANATAVKLFLINPGPVEYGVTLTLSTAGWNSFDIPLSTFSTNGINLSNVFQIKLEAVPFSYPTGVTTVYYDNLYFWKSANAPTITNFSIPNQLVGNPPVTITPPTSNSSGAFTYTSSNTNVATISGNMLTIVGAGTSTITANQAADGTYGPGSITTTLTVSYAPPSVPATTPTATSANVISVYSDAYTNVAGTDFFPNWGQSTVVADFPISGNNNKRLTNFNYQGVQLAASIDASTMQNVHIDLWSNDCTTFEFYLINTSPATVEQKFNITPINAGWNSIDIPLSHFTNINLSNIGQFKFVSIPSGTTVYYDNIYFWKAANTPTITNFSIPAQLLGAAPVTITPPTSNSNGAFTYTSSNTNVATISGNTITIVGVGSSTITANQAADGAYGTGSITTILTVAYPPPPTPAAAPPALSSANVYALYSDAFTPLTGGQSIAINWNPNWGQSTIVSDIMVSGNTTRKYENLNYQGVDFTPAIDVSAFNRLHLDVWTPNCTELKVFLINVGPPLVEQAVTLTPNNTGWNSFDIDLSLFRSIQAVNLTNVNQIKFEAIPFGTSTVYMDNIYFYNTIGLPITLKNFKANINRNVVNLNWSTVTETNNKGFAVEKSSDGINFNQIAFINGSNNSSIEKNYSTVDANPSIGNNYYRLKQVDFNGGYEYSSIEIVKFVKGKIGAISFYPNPAKKNLQVNVSEVSTNNAVLNLVNSFGQIVLSKSVPKTNNNINLNFDVANLTNGIYYLQFIDGSEKNIEKIIISKD